MRKKFTVIIADDNANHIDGLKALLNASDDLKVIGEAKDGLDAIRCIKEKKPDLALFDLNMPKMGGISVIKEIAVTIPDTKILVLTMHKDEVSGLDAFLAGAKGYCLKTSDHNVLLFAIRTVLSGKSYTGSEISDVVLKRSLKNKSNAIKTLSSNLLTKREKEVFKLLGDRYRYNEIADLLCISERTVKEHRKRIKRKLYLHSTEDLMAYA